MAKTEENRRDWLRKKLITFRDDPPVSLNWHDVAVFLLAMVDEIDALDEAMVRQGEVDCEYDAHAL